MRQEEVQQSVEPADRAVAACEILSLVSTFLLGAWAIPALSSDHVLIPVAIGAGIVFVVLSMRIRGETARELGFRFDNFGKAGLDLALPTLIASAIMFGLGLAYWGVRLGSLPVTVVAWALVQQFALQGFVNRRAQIIWGRGWNSCLLVAILFAIFHLPNLWLSVAAFVGGLIWAYVYQRRPNLLALSLSHALMTFVIVCTIPRDVVERLGVGFRIWVP